MSWVNAAIAVGSSLLSSAGGEEDESWKMEAEKQGKREAGLLANRGRALELLPAQAKRESDAAAQASAQVEQDRIAAQSSAVAQAAASGTAGVSVDQTVQQFDTSAAMVNEQIERQREAQMLQLDQDYEDIIWDAEMQRYDVKAYNTGGVSTGQRVAAAGLAGVSAWLASR